MLKNQDELALPLARRLFGVVVRTVGLITLLYGGWYLGYAGLLTFAPPVERRAIPDYVGSGVTCIVTGLLLMRGAEVIVRFAYPHGRDALEGE